MLEKVVLIGIMGVLGRGTLLQAVLSILVVQVPHRPSSRRAGRAPASHRASSRSSHRPRTPHAARPSRRR